MILIGFLDAPFSSSSENFVLENLFVTVGAGYFLASSVSSCLIGFLLHFYFKNNKLTLICFSLLSFSSIMSSQTVHNCNWVVKPGRVAPISILEYTNKWWRHIFIRVLFYFICCVHRNLSKSNLNPGLKFLFLFLTMNILATIYPTNTHFFIGISVAQPSAWGFGQNSNTLAIARPQIKLFLSKPLISAKSYKNQLN